MLPDGDEAYNIKSSRELFQSSPGLGTGKELPNCPCQRPLQALQVSSQFQSPDVCFLCLLVRTHMKLTCQASLFSAGTIPVGLVWLSHADQNLWLMGMSLISKKCENKIITTFRWIQVSDLPHFSFLQRTSFDISCKTLLLNTDSPNFWLFEKVPISLSHLRDNFARYRIRGWWVFTLNTWNISFHPSHLCVFWREVWRKSYPCSCVSESLFHQFL